MLEIGLSMVLGPAASIKNWEKQYMQKRDVVKSTRLEKRNSGLWILPNSQVSEFDTTLILGFPRTYKYNHITQTNFEFFQSKQISYILSNITNAYL